MAQQPTRRTVAIQGEPGSFSHEAACQALGTAARLLPCDSFDDLFAAVVAGRAERGVVPVENSIAGSVAENYDRLAQSTLHVVGETIVRVRLYLIARAGSSLRSIRTARSHPVALAQCRRFLRAHPHLRPVPVADTAGAVRALMRRSARTGAAIASAFAARRYGARVLRAGIEDDPANFTRFLVVAREPGAANGPAKTSLMFTVEHVPGALHRALRVFASHGLSLTKIESRPIVGRPWEYTFYVDILSDQPGSLPEALGELSGLARDVRVFGTYALGTFLDPTASRSQP